MDPILRNGKVPAGESLVPNKILDKKRRSSRGFSGKQKSLRESYVLGRGAAGRRGGVCLSGRRLPFTLSVLVLYCVLQASCSLPEKISVLEMDPEQDIYSEAMDRGAGEKSGTKTFWVGRGRERKILCKGTNRWAPAPDRPVFGGQLVAQLLQSAMKLDPEADPHMASCSFVDKVTVKGGEVKYSVSDKRNETRCAFEVVATGIQENRKCIEGEVKFVFKKHDSPLNYDPAGSLDVPDFDTMLTAEKYYSEHKYSEKELSRRLERLNDMSKDFEIRFDKPGHNIERTLAFQVKDHLDNTKANRYALVAYISDLFLLETGLALEKSDILSQKLNILSTEHTVHFCRMGDLRISKPIYYRMRLQHAGENFLICEGEILQEKKTIAIVRQKGVVRPRCNSEQPQSRK
jgi:acyl-CoA thioesterase II